MTTLSKETLAGWQADPISFINEVIYNPATGKAFDLLPAQKAFFAQCWKRTPAGRLVYPEQVYGAPKKSAKTGTAAVHTLTTTLVYGGRHAEGYCVANDEEQASSRVFAEVKRIVEASPWLRREAKVRQNIITFPNTGATIRAIASDHAGAAGGHPTISSFDELWGVTSERGRRLFDEMVPVPTRDVSCRLTTTYAGFEGESVLLEDLYKRGKSQPKIGDSLYAGDGILMLWSHEPLAPWQDEKWLQEMQRSLRPMQYARMIRNEFVSSESQFVDMAEWDACVCPYDIDPNERSEVFIGVDASVKRDSTALVAVTFRQGVVRIITHKVFKPKPDDPIDFSETIEKTLLEWKQRFRIRRVLFDPYQMVAVAQRLKGAGLPIEEYPQTVSNLTAATSNLFDLIRERRIILYPDKEMRLAASRAIIVKSARGWRLDKIKQSHHIDVIAALGTAALAAVKSPEAPMVSLFGPRIIRADGWSSPNPFQPKSPPPPPPKVYTKQEIMAQIGAAANNKQKRNW